MKTLIFTLAICTGIIFSQDALSNGNNKVPDKVVSISYAPEVISYEQELELLKDYVPVVDTSSFKQLTAIKVYDKNFNLIMEGTAIKWEEIENPELRDLLYDCDFLAEIGKNSIYIYSK